jgi:hypothetical protein
MTPEEQGLADAKAVWTAHFGQMDALIERFIGKSQWDRRDDMPDPWFKAMFYIERIKQLMWNKGRIDQAARRCKPFSAKQQQYDKDARDMELLADHIALLLMQHNRESKDKQ